MNLLNFDACDYTRTSQALWWRYLMVVKMYKYLNQLQFATLIVPCGVQMGYLHFSIEWPRLTSPILVVLNNVHNLNISLLMGYWFNIFFLLQLAIRAVSFSIWSWVHRDGYFPWLPILCNCLLVGNFIPLLCKVNIRFFVCEIISMWIFSN